MATFLKSGCPHFKGEYRKYLQADYNIYKALYEFIDNIILKCTKININIKISERKILNIIISDNYQEGFKDLTHEGTQNPFNMSHMREGQTTDEEISQFGIGMKAGAIAMSHRMDIYTRIDDMYYRVEMDFLEMCDREDPIKSFNPIMFEISIEEYSNIHPFEYGSSVKLSNIRDSIFSLECDIILDLRKNISITYTDIIRTGPINLRLNGEKVEPSPSFFEEPSCIPFNRNVKIYKLIKGASEEFYANFNGDEYKVFKSETGNLNKSSLPDIKKKFLDEGYKYSDSFSESRKECMVMVTTFTMYHPLMNTTDSAMINMPRNRILIYRDGRLYGNWHNEKSNDGCGNFTDTRLDIKSKKIVTDLGLTFNKSISQNHQNKVSKCINKLFINLKKGLNASTDSSSNIKLYEIALHHNIEVSKPSQIIQGAKEVNTLDRRPIKFREQVKKKVIKKIELEPVKITNRELLNLLFNIIKNHSSKKTEDYDLEKASLEDGGEIMYEKIFSVKILLEKYLKKK
jgi:hypothetical protein